MEGQVKKLVVPAVVAGLLVVVASASASPAVDSAIINIRIFNDDPNSVVTTANNYPVSLSIDDAQLNGPGGFANRHNFRLSDNGGVSEAVFLNGDAFNLFADVTLTGPANSEGGLQVAPWWSQAVDGVFTAITFNGEIAAFGGRLPFYTFNFKNPPVTYTKGETIRLGVKYRPNCLSEASPATIEYIVIKNGVTSSSGPRRFDQANPNEDPPFGLWGMLNDARVGGYFQPQINSADPNNWGHIDFENISFDPDPPAGPGLDIKPGSCPNPFNRGGHGVLPVALLGTVDFDATMVDISTVTLSRADLFLSGSVAPHQGPPGPHSVVEDVGTPFEGCGCECHDAGSDGIDDLMMHFKSDDVSAALQLAGMPAGSVVPLILTGNMMDGTSFATPTDCIWLVPRNVAPGLVRVTSNVPGTWVDVDPQDNTLDSGGFANFERGYFVGQSVTLTVQENQMPPGYAFRRWVVDGVLQPWGQRTIQVTVPVDMTARALYREIVVPGGDGRPGGPVQADPTPTPLGGQL